MKALPTHPWLYQLNPYVWLTELSQSLGSANDAGQHTRTPTWTDWLKRGSSQGLRGALLRSSHSVGSVANCTRCSCSHAYGLWIVFITSRCGPHKNKWHSSIKGGDVIFVMKAVQDRASHH